VGREVTQRGRRSGRANAMPQKRKGGGEGMGGGAALRDGAGSTQDAATANPADFACQISQVRARNGKARKKRTQLPRARTPRCFALRTPASRLLRHRTDGACAPTLCSWRKG
jgi:hypothetical protein